MDYNRVLEFAKEQLGSISRPSRHHFRDRYAHTLRVMKWGERIQKEEGGDLEVITLACILHDIGWDEVINHAIISRQISEVYLNELGYEPEKMQKVLEAIEYHNARDIEETLNLETFIVMDADSMDEVGALSVLWDAMSTATSEDASYLKAYERILEYTQILESRLDTLRTNTGKRMYQERLHVAREYLKNLAYELGIAEE